MMKIYKRLVKIMLKVRYGTRNKVYDHKLLTIQGRALDRVSIPQGLLIHETSANTTFCSNFQNFLDYLSKSHRCYSTCTCRPVLTRGLNLIFKVELESPFMIL